MNPAWVAIIAQYGLEFAIELAKILENKNNPTSADFQALKDKYASKTAAQYLAEAQAAIVPSSASASQP